MKPEEVGALISRLNLLWVELLRVYAIKEKLPLAKLNIPCIFISPEWQYQRLQLRHWISQWANNYAPENFKAIDDNKSEIRRLRQMFKSINLNLNMGGFTIISIDDFTASDLLLFSDETVSLSSYLERVKKKQVELIKTKNFGELSMYRFEEKAILQKVANQFAKDYPDLYFKASWFRTNEIVFWPTGSNYDMKELVKRSAGGTYKNN